MISATNFTYQQSMSSEENDCYGRLSFRSIPQQRMNNFCNASAMNGEMESGKHKNCQQSGFVKFHPNSNETASSSSLFMNKFDSMDLTPFLLGTNSNLHYPANNNHLEENDSIMNDMHLYNDNLFDDPADLMEAEELMEEDIHLIDDNFLSDHNDDVIDEDIFEVCKIIDVCGNNQPKQEKVGERTGSFASNSNETRTQTTVQAKESATNQSTIIQPTSPKQTPAKAPTPKGNTTTSTETDTKATPSAPEDTKITLNDIDVICGRNKSAFQHIGNRRFRVTISIFLQRFLDYPSRLDRAELGHEILDTVQESGSRFLKQNGKTGEWQELTHKERRDKIGHALRDAAAAFQRNGRSADQNSYCNPNPNQQERLNKNDTTTPCLEMDVTFKKTIHPTCDYIPTQYLKQL